MSTPNGSPNASGQSGSQGPSRPQVFTGPRPRWTETIQRHTEHHRTVLNLLAVVILIYFFLVAINMMGKGIKVTGVNPEYQKTFEGVAAFKKSPGEVMNLVATPTEAGGDSLIGQKAPTVGEVNREGGLIGYRDVVIPARCDPKLPRGRGVAAANSPVWIRGVENGYVLVEPIREYKDWLFTIFGYAKNPFLALLVGILITAIFQSSSFTTSFTVGLVATIGFPLESAVPIIMGANIGTSVTNIAVSMGYIRRKDEFRRAFAGATVHDFFNMLTVLVLFPLEVTTHVLSKLADILAGVVYHGNAAAALKFKPIEKIVDPLIGAFHDLLADVCGFNENVTGTAMTVTAVVILFVALLLLVKVLRKLVLRKAEAFFDRVLFRNAAVAFVFGLALTTTVQSSSVTTSLVVPLVAAGLLTLNQIFPYTVGANIGTTITAIIAAFAVSAATQGQAKVALTLACTHLLFNVIGGIIFYPLRWMPIGMAKALAGRAAESKLYAFAFIAAVFFGIPLIGVAVHALYERLAGG